MGQAERAFSAASTFMSGILAISASQFIGAPLKLVDPKFYDGYMAWTKESFAVLVTTITQWWAPTVVRVSGDESMKGQLYQMDDGTLKCNFPHRLVLMANHQLYTDWMYLWWVAYTNKMHGRIYIILKESIKYIPVLGTGMMMYGFIFLSRKWATDKERFQYRLKKLSTRHEAAVSASNPKGLNPMWLLIFPEGTNLSNNGRVASAKWAAKNNLPDLRHALLPRSTGLSYCLQELRDTVDFMYDCTVAYEGVPAGQYGQDLFSLRGSYFQGRPPKSVNMHWRRFAIADIPLGDEKVFAAWLAARWREKDDLLQYYIEHNRFPADSSLGVDGTGTQVKGAGWIETEVRPVRWWEFLQVFVPLAAVALCVNVVVQMVIMGLRILRLV